MRNPYFLRKFCTSQKRPPLGELQGFNVTHIILPTISLLSEGQRQIVKRFCHTNIRLLKLANLVVFTTVHSSSRGFHCAYSTSFILDLTHATFHDSVAASFYAVKSAPPQEEKDSQG